MKVVEDAFGAQKLKSAEALFEIVEKRMEELALERSA